MHKYILLASAFLASQVAAHGAVTSYVIDGTTYQGYSGFSPTGQPTIEWQWPDYNPSTATASSVRCNGGTSAQLSANVKQGGSIRALWAQWTHIPSSVAVYLYPCPNGFSGCTVTGKGWFKIDEAAVLSGTVGGDDWAGNTIIKTGGWTSTVPAGLKPGNYIVRHELIARHQANNPQFYAECAQITVTGSGGSLPDDSYTVAIPSTAYADPSDNMLNFEVNGSTMPGTQYKVTGPPVWGKGGSTNPPPQSSAVQQRTTTTTTQAQQRTTTTTQAQRTTTTTQAQRTTTTTYSQPSPTGGACASKWGQCGGQGYNGPTCCQSGSTCTFSNAWYSQCL